HRAIEIVPVIEHPERKLGSVDDIEIVERLASLNAAQQRERAVKDADVAVGGNQRDSMAIEMRRANDETLVADPLNVLPGGKHDRAVLDVRSTDAVAEQAQQAPLEFVGSGLQRWTRTPHHDACRMRRITGARALLDRLVA